ncbi:uncharacterized protein SCDLUD_004963 [Saccharomycodes ludwigii]|uniref:uncharacterized protein n=1 Tax=Saccharomycodes ludwigii TaxID=36035 RepID=UPI001E858E19|nr:hypothetical protein SCDLUD_004963 [Saccharomycodes ludwigii]KAH3899517.1 hypothetical protein SCDLUD_004963 [Saccharomycodes ludwigii]
MDKSLQVSFTKFAVSDFIANLSLIINHAIDFRPEFTRKNERSDQPKKKYTFPVLISDPLKLSGGCLPKFVVELYKASLVELNFESVFEQDCYRLNDYNFKNIYMNRALSKLEYNRLNKVVSACFYTLYKCILRYNELEQDKKMTHDIITNYLNNFGTDRTSSNNTTDAKFKRSVAIRNNRYEEIFQKSLFITENRFSRIFKTFVGITFKEYETFCFQTLKENYEVLKPYIDIISELDYTIDLDIWENLTCQILNGDNCNITKSTNFYNSSNNNATTTAKHIENNCLFNSEFLYMMDYIKGDINKPNNCDILLPQTFSLQNYKISSDKQSKLKKKGRKRVLLKKVPRLGSQLFKKYDYYLKELGVVKDIKNLKIDELKTFDSDFDKSNSKLGNNVKAVISNISSKDNISSVNVKNCSKHSNDEEDDPDSLATVKFTCPKVCGTSSSANTKDRLADGNGTNNDYYTNNIDFSTSNFFLSSYTINMQNHYTNDHGSANKLDIATMEGNSMPNDEAKQQQLYDSSFQTSYIYFCLSCKGKELYLNDYIENNENCELNATGFYTSQSLINSAITTGYSSLCNLADVTCPIVRTTSEIIKEMLSNKEYK